MREKKIFDNKSILLFLICLIFSYILFKSSPKFPEIKFRKKENRKTRKLIDSQKVYEICKNSPKEVFNFYYNNSEFKLSEKIEYKDNEEYIQNIITMLDEKKKDNKKIKKYIIHILPYFFLLVITFSVPTSAASTNGISSLYQGVFTILGPFSSSYPFAALIT